MNEQSSEPTAGGPRIEDHLKARSTWMRLLFMILFLVLYSLSRLVVTAVIVIQFFHVLLTGERNQPLLGFGQSLATYTYQIVAYLTFVTDVRPFPFDVDWPSGTP